MGWPGRSPVEKRPMPKFSLSAAGSRVVVDGRIPEGGVAYSIEPKLHVKRSRASKNIFYLPGKCANPGKTRDNLPNILKL
uniref:Uncharacterized protein n=1 Tax=Romanomermis culicivorax TaxID=13658 RepID=A0A915KM53_ROMCU